jgi:hypothetical protein
VGFIISQRASARGKARFPFFFLAVVFAGPGFWRAEAQSDRPGACRQACGQRQEKRYLATADGAAPGVCPWISISRPNDGVASDALENEKHGLRVAATESA